MKRAVVAMFMFLVLLLSVQNFGNLASAQIVGRSVTIPVKVILIGFDRSQLDLSYLSWSGAYANLPASISNMVFDSGNTTGVVFRPQYSLSFAPADFKGKLESYLRSIGQQKSGNNPWFGKWEIDSRNGEYANFNPVAIDYVVYDADSVENWLWNHLSDIGGSTNGWTLVISYMPELPSLTFTDYHDFKNTNGETFLHSKPHYYGISRVDSDLGYKLRYRDFMSAWGGHHRMWFIDLSAGPVFNSQYEDLPLQVELGDNRIDLSSAFGKTWLTEYVSDYVAQATYNFIAPNFVYQPEYAPNYQIDVFLFDARNAAAKAQVPIDRTINKTMIEVAFEDLVPYSTVTVNLSFEEVTSDLGQLIQSNYKYTDSWTEGAIFGTPERYGVVDVRPIFKYIGDHITSYEPNPFRTETTVTIPAFAFAFDSETYFTYTYKWVIGKTDMETGALLGIALPHAAFISFNQWEFTRGDQITPPQPRKGEGFTETIIHEVGHEFGLMHPHQYGDIGDFIYSAMGYFTNDYVFGQIDKDALRRAHVDQIYMATEKLLNAIPRGVDTSDIRNELTATDVAYNNMDYADAIPRILQAYQLAKQASGRIGQTESTTTEIVLAAIVVGVVAVFVVAFLVMRRKRRKHDQSRLAWVDITGRS